MSKTGDNLSLAAAIELGFLSDSQLEKIRQNSEDSNYSEIEVAVRKGFINRQELEILEAFRSPLDVAPGYQIDGMIGRGGGGVVFMATQLGLDRPVALKTIKNSLLKKNELAHKRFEREARIIGQLQHPNIVAAIDFGVHNEQLYLAMEFIDGMDAEKHLDRRGTMPENYAWHIARQICHALEYANELGVIHRDIKPANLIFTSAPTGSSVPTEIPFVKIADFGLARFKDSAKEKNITLEGAINGTPFYMSPEQISANELDHRSDIFALGATIWHLILGSPPIDANSPMEIVSERMKLKDDWTDGCPAGLSDDGFELIQDMCRFNRDDRIGNYSQLNARIKKILDKQGPFASETGELPASDESAEFTLNANVTFIDDLASFDANIDNRQTQADTDFAQAKSNKVSAPKNEAPAKTPSSSFWNWKAGLIGICLLAGTLAITFAFWPAKFGRGSGPEYLEHISFNDLTGPPIFLFDGLSVDPRQQFTGTWEVAEGAEGESVLSGTGTRNFRCLDASGTPLLYFRFDCGFRHQDAKLIEFRLLDRSGETGFQAIIAMAEASLHSQGTKQLSVPIQSFDEATLGYHQFRIESQPEHWRILVDSKLLGTVLKPEMLNSEPFTIQLRVDGTDFAHFEQIRFRRFDETSSDANVETN